MKKVLFTLLFTTCALIANAQVPYVSSCPVSTCTQAKSYFSNHESELASIEGVWAITYTMTQSSFLYSQPREDQYETTFYIIRASSPSDCFGVYICDGNKLTLFMAIRELNDGLYQFGWCPKTCENSDIKNFRVKKDGFKVKFTDISKRLKKQIFDKIGDAVKVNIQIEGEKL